MRSLPFLREQLIKLAQQACLLADDRFLCCHPFFQAQPRGLLAQTEQSPAIGKLHQLDLELFSHHELIRQEFQANNPRIFARTSASLLPFTCPAE